MANTPTDGKDDAKVPVIAGFELLKRVGRGGMGAVYRARQISVDRIVAVKILRPELSHNRTFIERFREEAKVAARLNHPNLVQAIDSGEEGGYYYFAMEYIDGETLHQQMLREGVLDEKRAWRVALDVSHALNHAAAHGIVHRDIKPGNIMVSRDGVTKLCDMGLARLREAEVDAGTRGAAVGTPYYISPEQALGQIDVDTRSDIYSLGATLFRALVGRPAFDAPTKAEILEKHVRSPLPWPRDYNPALSENTCYVIAKMMAKKAQERYETPDDLSADIERLLADEAPKSSVIQLEMPPVRLSAEERAVTALTDTRLRQKRQDIRTMARLREEIDRVASEEGIPAQSVLRHLRGNLDETRPETFLKYGVIQLADRRFHQACRDFRRAAALGADVSRYMAKLDALGAPAGMSYVPAGEFLSGPPDAQKTVTLEAYYIDISVVTNRKYHDYLRAQPTGSPPGHWIDRDIPAGLEDYPVMNITWEDARAYAAWAGKRLPTAAEWEKAARGTDGRRYPWGQEFERLRCNTAESGINDLTLAGRYPRGASPYGCLDMYGNVVQWCADAGPIAPEEPDGRAVCGVSYDEPGEAHGVWRLEFRKRLRRSRKCGLRCVLAVAPVGA